MSMLSPNLADQKSDKYNALNLKLKEDLKDLLKSSLPSPKNTPRTPLHLSLREAILLALRNQPLQVDKTVFF